MDEVLIAMRNRCYRVRFEDPIPDRISGTCNIQYPLARQNAAQAASEGIFRIGWFFFQGADIRAALSAMK